MKNGSHLLPSPSQQQIAPSQQHSSSSQAPSSYQTSPPIALQNHFGFASDPQDHLDFVLKYIQDLAGKANEAAPYKRHKAQHDDIPSSIVPLMSDNVSYIKDDLNAIDDPLLNPTTIHSMRTLCNVIKKYGSQFLESVIVFDNYVLFPTSLDGFMHQQTLLDDAADSSPPFYYNKTTAIINEKTYNGRKYYEASLYIGQLELLIVGGFFGHKERITSAFLGSSIPDLPDDLKKSKKSNYILFRKTATKFSQTQRMLRQYAKCSSKQQWSLVSTHYSTKGFYPVTAINFNQHTYFRNKTKSLTYVLASYSIQCITKTTTHKEDIISMLFTVMQNKQVIETVKGYGIASFADLHKALESERLIATSSSSSKPSKDTETSQLHSLTNTTSPDSQPLPVIKNALTLYFINIISLLKKFEHIANANDEEFNLLSIMPALKNDDLMLLNGGFTVGIRTANDGVAKTFKTSHPSFFI
ncbi:hypothetical protein INT45_013598 [Circinella minor]|uniref:Uncharacterized protein n=1 Tax=Circinella minor TaxID=1195481 RepID=A0A8H7VEB8_9FUNG|nr:hypothetical protein INT45_013598 [Circinella minor]